MLRFIFGKARGFLLLSLLLCALGAWLATQLPVMMYPQTRRPMVSVRFSHPGISALDFREDYAERIEPGLAGLAGVDLMETSYSADSSTITLTFDWNIRSDAAKASVQTAMQSINAALPADIRDAYSIRFREGENAGYIVLGVNSASAPPEELMKLLVANVEPRLRGLRDVEDYGIFGLEELKVSVSLDQRAMLDRGVTINDVNAAFQAGLSAQPLGTLREDGERYSVRIKREEKALASLDRLQIAGPGGSSVALGDIAAIDIRHSVPSRVFLIEDQPAIQINLTPVEGGNLNRMTDELMSVLKSAVDGGLLPGDCRFERYVDPAKYINRSIRQVAQAALIGGALAILIVFLILGEPRNTLIIAVSLPVSILLSFSLMYLFGVSLNLISLGGFALAVGMIVDSTIVVMENIHRWRRDDTRALNSAMWKRMVMDATRQVRAPVLASTLTSVLVFLPLSFTAPLANAILGNQAMTVVFSLLCSLAVSLTLVPVVAYLLFKGPQGQKLDHLGPRGFERVSEPVVGMMVGAYKRALSWLLARRPRSAAFLGLSFAAMGMVVALLLPRIPREIMSTPESDRVVLFFRHEDYQSSVDIVERALPELMPRLDEALAGLAHRSYANASGRMNQLLVDFEDTAEAAEAKRRLEQEFVSEGSWYFNVQAWDPAALPLPQAYALQVSVYGPDSSVKAGILDDMQRLLNESRLYGRSFTRPTPSLAKELVLIPRESVIAGFQGLSSATLIALVRRALGGTASISFSDGQYDVSVAAAYPPGTVDSRALLADFLVPHRGAFVPLKHFFDIEERSAVSQVYAENGELAFRLYASSSAELSDARRLELERETMLLFSRDLSLPAGYSFAFDNPRVEIDGAITSLFIALGISVALIYLLLCFQFDSLWLPLVILVTIPLGFVGVVLSLFVFRSTLNLNSLLGTILLGGVVVNNAIIFIDFYLKSRTDHADRVSALVATAGLRFQPILITTLTTIIGMLPIALGFGSGASILQPLGIAVSGGLVFSALLTLFVVPAILSFWRNER